MINKLKYSDCLNKWYERDWYFFSDLIYSSTDELPVCLDFSLLLAGASQQVSDEAVARKMLDKALSINVNYNKHICDFLISINEIQLGRANYVLGRFGPAITLILYAYKKMGEKSIPLFYGFLCEYAEQCLTQNKTREAIQVWQDIATILQEKTPEEVYHRMSYCYSVNKEGFGGTSEENAMWGDSNKHDVLDFFHLKLQPDFYFEIGVDEGKSLSKARGAALGVDARPELDLKVELHSNANIVGMSSDAFFFQQANDFLSTGPDLAFIDGMHLFEFALRDFINLEKYAAPYALICIDDIFPCHPVQAERRRRSAAWTGDVWKLLPIFEKYRPDLSLISISCSTTGLLLIAGLDNKNTKLEDNYEQILKDYQGDLVVPEKILMRTDSIASDHPIVSFLLDSLKAAKNKRISGVDMFDCLEYIRIFLKQEKFEKALPYRPKSIDIDLLEKKISAYKKFQTQLFIPQTEGALYVEKNSYKVALSGGAITEVVFAINGSLVKDALRFDPSSSPGVFEILSVSFSAKKDGVEFLSIKNKCDLEMLRLDGDVFLLKNSERFLFYSYANDPKIYFPKIEFADEEYEVKVELQRIEDLKELREIWRNHI